jgi:hypothetical protein
MQAPMPKTVRISLWLLVGSVVASPLITIMDPAPLPKLPTATWQIVLMTILSIGLALFLAVMTYRGRNWARWVHAFIFVFGSLLAFLFLAQSQESSTSHVISSLDAIVYAAEVISVALLFVRESNAWYSGNAQVLPDISLQRP